MRFTVHPISKLHSIDQVRPESRLVRLGLYSEKAAMMLNTALWADLDQNPGTYSIKNGFFVPDGYGRRSSLMKITKSDVEFFIDSNGEVVAYVDRIDDFMKSDGTDIERNIKVKSHLADALKSYFLSRSKNNAVRFVKSILLSRPETDGDGNTFTATFNEYRAIYEKLKGRPLEKILKKNGQEAVDSVIGKPIANEFKVNAIMMLNERLKQLREKCVNDENAIEEECHAKLVAIHNEKELKIADLRRKFLADEAELNAQIKRLMEAENV